MTQPNFIEVYRVRVRYAEDSWSAETFLHYGSGLEAYQKGLQVGKRLGIQNPKVNVNHVGQLPMKEEGVA